MRAKLNRSLLLTLLVMIDITAQLSAQKLPNKQKGSLWATYHFEKPEGFPGDMQAYNTATQVYYTIANDDQNIYFKIKAVDGIIIRKIMYGGVTIGLSAIGDKSAKAVKVALPLLSGADKSMTGGLGNIAKEVRADKELLLKYTDSVTKVLNARIGEKASVKITGLPGLKDSVFNIRDLPVIKAMTSFERTGAYVCILSVPIKDLQNVLGQATQLNYNIKLNGSFGGSGTSVELTADGKGIMRSTPGYPSVVMSVSPENLILDFVTDVSGEYVLAKKP